MRARRKEVLVPLASVMDRNSGGVVISGDDLSQVYSRKECLASTGQKVWCPTVTRTERQEEELEKYFGSGYGYRDVDTMQPCHKG